MTAKQPRGIRLNNGGNIKRSGDKWQGLADQQLDKTFFTFKGPEWGIRAMAAILINYQDKYGLRTIKDVIKRWAPPGVDNNPDTAYITYVATKMNKRETELLDLHKWEDLFPMIHAMVQFEQGMQPYDKATYEHGLRLAGVQPPVKEVLATKTGVGATVTGSAGILSNFTDYIPLVNQLPENVRIWVIVGVIVLGAGLILWGRIDSRRKAGV